MQSNDTILAGRDAWQRLQERDRQSWGDWIAIGRALVVGRTEAMKASETNRPYGLKYTRAMKQWLNDNSLADINDQERYRVIQCVENLPAIEAWRNSLDQPQRQRLNNPKGVWIRWKQSTNVTAPKPQRRSVSNRPLQFDSEMIERAAHAIRASCSRDYVLMARRALQAAIRNEADLLALRDGLSGKHREREALDAAAVSHAA